MLGKLSYSTLVRRTVMFSALVLVFLFISEGPLFAQTGGSFADTSDGGLTGMISSVRGGLFSVLKIIIVLSAGFALVMVGLAVVNGEKESLRRFGTWAIGLTLAFSILTALQHIPINSGGGFLAAGSFSGFYSTVKNLALSMLIIVAMITCVEPVIKVIQGEKEGGRHVFKWFLVATLGISLLSVL